MPNALGSCFFWLTTDKRRDTPLQQRPNFFHKNDHASVQQSFHGEPSGDEDLKHHPLQPGDSVYWKRPLQKNSHWRDTNQILLTNTCAANLQGIDLDSCDAPKESAEPWLHITLWPESKDFLELKQTIANETAFPRHPDQACWKFVKHLMITSHFRWSPVSMILITCGP